jgi:alkanesulfonate monooxygenase SsuD/methylene tetrahydromethanopterin reductase-like flavin-dependent oxidoreductase (luciferase family)
MLTWMAAATNRIALASRVLSLPFRSPALVAKMAESFDRLSSGRLILGLGAGATDSELQDFGLSVPSPREKIDGLADALSVIRGLWARAGFSYRGPVHHTDVAEMEPKPAHRIPLWLGTFGDRALAATGRQADGWIPSFGPPSGQLPAMREKVLAAAALAGRGPHEITCTLNVEIAITERDDRGTDVVVGPADRIASRLGELVALGFTAFNFIPVGTPLTEQTERLATEVIPAVRAMS